MRGVSAAAVALVAIPLLSQPSTPPDSAARQSTNAPAGEHALMRSDSPDIEHLDLYGGPGGRQDQPRGVMTYLDEDLNGTNPKFRVIDGRGTKWTVKLGPEARPETAASRLVWAAGYFANEDYFLPEMKVEGLPSRLKRGNELVEPGGIVRNVRLKRHSKTEKDSGVWQWGRNPFVGTRELAGLRVIMALINNWDLKDDNNAIYEDRAGEGPPKSIYLVSDLGAAFGTTGALRSHEASKGNLKAYSTSRFITDADAEKVDFAAPSRPSIGFLINPWEYFSRLGLRWIGRDIPRADARWIGQTLGRLSDTQIRDAFRAAGYAPQEIDGFAKVVEERIADLSRLSRPDVVALGRVNQR